MFRAMHARTDMARSVPQTMDETTERLTLFETAQTVIGSLIASLYAQIYVEEASAAGDPSKVSAMTQRIDELQTERESLDYEDPVSLQATITKYAAPSRRT